MRGTYAVLWQLANIIALMAQQQEAYPQTMLYWCFVDRKPCVSRDCQRLVRQRSRCVPDIFSCQIRL
jgi:hypothetical protein